MNAWRVWALTFQLSTSAALGLLQLGVERARADVTQPERGAAPKAPVVLDSQACPAVAQDELRELIALELAPRRLAGPRENLEPHVVHARIHCADNHARLSVEDSTEDRRQELELDLQETMPAARTRLLALTLSELIATLDMELAQPARAAANAPPGPPAANQARLSAETCRGHWWLGAGLAREGRPALLAPALHSGVLWYVPELPLALWVDLLGSHGRRTLSEGSLSTWTLAGSALLGARLQTTWVEVLLGAGVRLGYARLAGAAHGDALSGGAVASWWWGPLVSAGLLIRLHGRWGVRTALELAYVAKPVRGLDSKAQAAYALERLQLHALVAVSVGFR
jgi:hypothetical protein